MAGTANANQYNNPFPKLFPSAATKSLTNLPSSLAPITLRYVLKIKKLVCNTNIPMVLLFHVGTQIAQMYLSCAKKRLSTATLFWSVDVTVSVVEVDWMGNHGVSNVDDLGMIR